MTERNGGSMKDLISRQEAIYAVNTALFPKINTAKDAEKALRNLPPAQPETHEERTETHACDCIERQAAICVIAKWMLEYGGEGEERERNALKKATEDIKELPSAQPELPEWAKKVEEYRKSAPSHIHNPLAWALYQTWKEYDR